MEKAKHLLLFIILLLFAQQEMEAQCNVPGPGSDCTFNITYDELYLYSDNTYGLTFQGSGDGFGPDVLILSEVDEIQRAILYRPEGTTEWEVQFDFISDDDLDYSYSVYGLAPCTTYEFRITCQGCNQAPFLGGPNPLCQAQLCEMIELGELSQIFTRKTGAALEFKEPIENIEITPLSETEVEITWDPIPGVYRYEVNLRGFPNLCIKQQNTTTNSVVMDITELSTCESCSEFRLRIRSKFECPTSSQLVTGYTAIDTFPMGGCTARINYLRPFNHTALVDWEPMFGDPEEYLVEWWPTDDPALVTSISLTTGPFTIPDLEIFTSYEVRVTPVCSGGGCVVGDIKRFTSDCNTYEPNNTIGTAWFIPFNTELLTRIEKNGDDYFSFIPTCNAIQVERSPARSYRIYKDGELVQGITVENHDYTDYFGFYNVVAGEEYVIQFLHNNHSECYTFKVKPCSDCDKFADQIYGWNWLSLNGSAVETEYAVYGVSSQITWGISGPAEIIYEGGIFTKLRYYEPGIVNITAVITACDGTTKVLELEVVIEGEGECYCGPITSITPGVATSSSDGEFTCYRDLVATDISCSGTTYNWSFQYYFPDGSFKQTNATTSDNSITISDEGYVGQCYTLTTIVSADCTPGSSNNYNQTMQICWNDAACSTIEFGGDGRGEGGGLAELYPNPAKDELTVAWQDLEVARILVYDLNGRVLSEQQIEQGVVAETLNLQNFEPGLYLLQLVSKEGERIVNKFSILR